MLLGILGLRELVPTTLIALLSGCSSNPSGSSASASAQTTSSSSPSVAAGPLMWPFFGSDALTCFEPLDFPTKLPPPLKPTPTRIEEFAKRRPDGGYFVSGAYVVHESPCQCNDGSCGECHPFVIVSDVAAAGLKEPLSPDFDVVVFLSKDTKLERFKLYRITFEVCSVPLPARPPETSPSTDDSTARRPPRPTRLVSAEQIP